MRISDWSSDVCSSDLAGLGRAIAAVYLQRRFVGDHHVRDRLQLHPKWLEQLLHNGRSEDCSAILPRHSGSTSANRSEEHTSELQSLMRISYAVFCLKKKKNLQKTNNNSKQTNTN